MKNGKKLIIESGGVLHIPPKTESDSSGKWTASIWKLDQKNLNGRIYPTALAKRIVAEAPKTVAYDGHEAQYHTGAEYEIVKAVCSNPRIEDNELRVDIDFVDEAYKAILEGLVAKGIAIGVSSVGWGCEDQDGRIDPDTYELVRFLDFVTCPAGEVYATKESKERGTRGGADGSVDRSTTVEERRELARAMAKILRRREER